MINERKVNVEGLGFTLAAPGAAPTPATGSELGEVLDLGRLPDFTLWDALRRRSLEWRLKVMALHVEPSDKNYVSILRIQNEISAETLRVYKAVDEQPFKRPVEDRSAEHRARWEKLKRARVQDAEIIDITPTQLN